MRYNPNRPDIRARSVVARQRALVRTVGAARVEQPDVERPGAAQRHRDPGSYRSRARYGRCVHASVMSGWSPRPQQACARSVHTCRPGGTAHSAVPLGGGGGEGE
jgi:hypothetical protein